jgi:hypothetical protein
MLWFRVRARSIAATALLSLVTLIVGSAASHQDDCHDEMSHEPSAHSIGRDTSNSNRPMHCVLCHWTRIVRPSADVAHYFGLTVERNARSFVDVVSAPQAIVAAQPPLRAPPSSPALDA